MDTVVVTGATDPLGRAVAAGFADRAETLVLGVRDPEAGNELAGELTGDVHVVRADPRDEFDTERLMEQASRAGDTTGIDVLAPCARVYHGPVGETPLHETPYSAFDDTLRTNARGVFSAITEAVPHLTPDARILVPTAGVGSESAAGYGAFAVSAAATSAVVRGFRADLPDVTLVELEIERAGGMGDVDLDAASNLFLSAVDRPAEELDDGRLTLADVPETTGTGSQ